VDSTPSFKASAAASAAASTATSRQGRATPGIQEPVHSLRVSTSANDENQRSTPAGIGPNLPADMPHIRLETPQVRPEVADNPGEVSHVLQEPGDDRRETVFNKQFKDA
jgi:hypothetical protein